MAPAWSRALVFCVPVRHAEFMAERLNAAGLPALAVTGETPRRDQLRAPHLLAEGKVCALVTVDLYNEGVDIPEVDTLLLLRPTQSPVLFQQQIGRGLRLMPGKESCLNIAGNRFPLVTRINYPYRVVYIRFVGTHEPDGSGARGTQAGCASSASRRA